jgi:AmpE protein
MTILIVLFGLLISHFATGFRRVRDFRWLNWVMEQVRARAPGLAWLPFAVVLLASLLLAAVLTGLVTWVLGLLGWALLALAVFIYTLGPRDLDHDVQTLASRKGDASPEAVADAARAMQLTLDDPPAAAAAAVFHAGLSRWFGVLFWFVVLGIPGALIYRLTRVALQIDGLERDQIDWLARLRMVLDWPILALLVISAALCGDLDRVHRAWREQHQGQPAWLLTPNTLDHIAAAIVPADADFDQGLAIGHQMVWRMLILWLVALSVMLLAGWLV